MGNCQAAEAATVVIQRPGGGGNIVERIYWSVSAGEVMSSNPGHYVAMVVASTAARAEGGAAMKQLKLLRRNDTLLLGQVYRLISFEDVLKEFAAKKNARLGRLLKQYGHGIFNAEINSISSNIDIDKQISLDEGQFEVLTSSLIDQASTLYTYNSTTRSDDFRGVDMNECISHLYNNLIHGACWRGHHRVRSTQSGGGNSNGSNGGGRGLRRHSGGGGQWKPALQTIAELGT